MISELNLSTYLHYFHKNYTFNKMQHYNQYRTANHRYDPLDSTIPEIRVVKLLPSEDFATPIQCQLLNRPLYDKKKIMISMRRYHMYGVLRVLSQRYFWTVNFIWSLGTSRWPCVISVFLLHSERSRSTRSALTRMTKSKGASRSD